MPSAISDRNIITKFTNCRLVKDGQLLWDDLWVSSATGKILRSQEVFYGDLVLPDRVIDLDGKVISPGLIDVQLNGAFGVDFSHVPDDVSTYPKLLKQVNKSLITMGVTSYLPTLTSQRSEVYHHVSI
jgi:N-acetylglucosamine-6-phosphate deacetylase